MIDPVTAMMAGKVVLGATKAISQKVKANKAGNAAESNVPDLVDPNMSAYLNELAQKKRSLETGAEMASSLKNIDQTTAVTQEAITNVSGGDSSGTIQGMLQAQAVGSRAKNDALASGQRNQMALNSFYDKTLNRIADQKLQLQLLAADKKSARWAGQEQGAGQNAMATAGAATGLVEPLMALLKPKPEAGATTGGMADILGGGTAPAGDAPAISNSGMPSIPTGDAAGGLDVESLLGGLSTGS